MYTVFNVEMKNFLCQKILAPIIEIVFIDIHTYFWIEKIIKHGSRKNDWSVRKKCRGPSSSKYIVLHFLLYTHMKSKCVPERNRKIWNHNDCGKWSWSGVCHFLLTVLVPIFAKWKNMPENYKIIPLNKIPKIDTKIWKVHFFLKGKYLFLHLLCRVPK